MSHFRTRLSLRLAVLAGIAVLCLLLAEARAHDPDALWKIVHGQCVTHEIARGTPAPCERVDLAKGSGFAVLKDRVGIAQYLVIPTRRVTGIGSPQLLAADSPNYWAFAWQTRTAVEARLHRRLARDKIALAINSAYGRSQNQLHIHVDCIRPVVLRRLRQHSARIGRDWTPLETRLQGHRYWAMRLDGSTLGPRDPFKLLAQGIPGARKHMERWTLVVVGAPRPPARDGFLLLADQVDILSGDRASGEELLDHRCAVAAR